MHTIKLQAIKDFLEVCVEPHGDMETLLPKMLELASSSDLLGVLTAWNASLGEKAT